MLFVTHDMHEGNNGSICNYAFIMSCKLILDWFKELQP